MENLRTGEIVTLQAKTKKGKDRINQQGSKWLIEAITESVLFDDKKGVWLGLSSKRASNEGFRWVHFTDDENFLVIRKESM